MACSHPADLTLVQRYLQSDIVRAATGSRAETVATVTVSLGSGASAEGFAGAGLVAGRGAPAAEHGAAAAQGQAGATAGGSSELQARITGECVYRNETLTENVVEVQDLDVVWDVRNMEECCGYCLATPPCNAFLWCNITAPGSGACFENPETYAAYSELDWMGIDFIPGYCWLLQEPNPRDRLTRRVVDNEPGTPWGSGIVLT